MRQRITPRRHAHIFQSRVIDRVRRRQNAAQFALDRREARRLFEEELMRDHKPGAINYAPYTYAPRTPGERDTPLSDTMMRLLVASGIVLAIATAALVGVAVFSVGRLMQVW